MNLPLSVSFDSKEPIYYQIEIQLKSLILSGQLPPGTMLPSIRSLSSQLACSVITTRRAYLNLENEGFLKTVQGKGTFVNTMDQESEIGTKREIVSAALEKAVEQAELIGCKPAEIRAVFEEIMKTREI